MSLWSTFPHWLWAWPIRLLQTYWKQSLTNVSTLGIFLLQCCFLESHCCVMRNPKLIILNVPKLSKQANVRHMYLGIYGFPGGASDKEPTCQCRRHKRCGFDPWVGKIPWRRTHSSNPLQYSWPENSMDIGAWWRLVHSVSKSGTQLK